MKNTKEVKRARQGLATALIGCGYWGSKLLKHLQADKRFKVLHVCDSKTDLSKVWAEVEAVVVATPIDTHHQLIKEALFQKKDVFSAKPLTMKTNQGLKLERLAKKQGLVLAVDYTWTFSRALRKAKTIDIGKIKAIEMEIKQLGRFKEWGADWLLGSHLLSILEMFIPLETLDFKRINLVRNRGRVESNLILFKSKSIQGSLSASLNCPEKSVKVIIYGTKGTIIYQPKTKETLKVFWYRKTSTDRVENLIVKTRVFRFDEANNLKQAVDYFYKVLKGKEKSNLEMAIRVTQILEGLEKNPQGFKLPQS